MDLLHVGEKPQSLRLELPERDYIRWELLSRSGNASDQILRTASELDASLIAMTTDGAGGLFSAPRGSVTERVVQGAPCPVLAVPVEL
jgi:nucleotide-binding universal stress UspA family protein